MGMTFNRRAFHILEIKGRIPWAPVIDGDYARWVHVYGREKALPLAHDSKVPPIPKLRKEEGVELDQRTKK